ncbi:DoxX family protein [Peredibacter sp. HCB2-198]|uniref:DoxX family protein n=1 Tax=Peredibacter sp. HCB2-198 TaxID=3383025 RepID=UPI0038B62C70
MSVKSKKVIVGHILGVLPVLILFFSAYMKFNPNPEALAGMAKSGIPVHLLPKLGLLEILCTVLFLIPRTSVLGAILLTGYLGGAIFAHVRIEDAVGIQIVLGFLVWGSLFLKDERVRQLLPIKK